MGSDALISTLRCQTSLIAMFVGATMPTPCHSFSCSFFFFFFLLGKNTNTLALRLRSDSHYGTIIIQASPVESSISTINQALLRHRTTAVKQLHKGYYRHNTNVYSVIRRCHRNKHIQISKEPFLSIHFLERQSANVLLLMSHNTKQYTIWLLTSLQNVYNSSSLVYDLNVYL